MGRGPQGAGRKMSQALGVGKWWWGRSSSSRHLCSLSANLPQIPRACPCLRGTLSVFLTECFVLPSPFCSDLPNLWNKTPGLFLLLSVKGWVLSVSDGVGAKCPGERLDTPSALPSLPEEPSAFDVSAWCWMMPSDPVWFAQ